MHRPAWLASFVLALLAAGASGADESPQSSTVIGALNQRLAQGSAALEAGRYEEGVRLSLEGLDDIASRRDLAAGHANLCAGYAALKRFDAALPHCNRSIELDGNNWRAFNNRAAVFVGLQQFDLAMTDVNTGLAMAPDSPILRKSAEVVKEHRDAARRDKRRRPVRA
ncbi:MAG TPA: hypothetical protein VMF52_19625 [Steroidobacteraceae bacterium]|nr:hypothetical protein [Steroidobacteraceae bacterium]